MCGNRGRGVLRLDLFGILGDIGSRHDYRLSLTLRLRLLPQTQSMKEDRAIANANPEMENLEAMSAVSSPIGDAV